MPPPETSNSPRSRLRVGFHLPGEFNTRGGGYEWNRRAIRALLADNHDVIYRSGRQGAEELRARTDLDVLVIDSQGYSFWADGVPHERALAVVHHLTADDIAPPPQHVRAEQQFLAHLSGWIATSSATAARVSHVVGVPLSDIAVCRCGADGAPVQATPLWIRSRATMSGPLRVLYVGNLIPRKAALSVVRAVEESGSNVSLRIVGNPHVDRAYTDVLNRAIDQSSADIKLLGVLSVDLLVREYLYCHVLAVPSHYEGFGLVYAEGGLAGLPAFAAASGGARELIQDGVNGWLVTPDDIQTMSINMMHLHDDRPLLAEMSEAACDRARAWPKWEEVMRGWLQIVHRFVRDGVTHNEQAAP